MATIRMQTGNRPLPGPGIFRLTEHPNESYICLTCLADIIRDCLPDVSADDYRTRSGRKMTRATCHLDFLSHAEINQVNGFKTLKKQVEWIGGRYALKTLAAEVLPGIGSLRQIRVAYETRGAPYLVARSEISISISHAGDYALAGLCLIAGKRIGLDIEQMAREGLDSVKQVAFTEQEMATAGDSLEKACRIWTRKEAYLKFIKAGFGESLKRIDVSGPGIWHGGVPITGIAIQTTPVAAQYLMSIVSHRDTVGPIGESAHAVRDRL